MSSSADIHQKIEAACAKQEQERLAAEAEEAAMLKEMEERLEEEKRMEEVRIAMEIEKQESEQNQWQILKEKWRVEKRQRQEEEEDVPVVVKRVRRNGEVEDKPQAEASGSRSRACWNCRSCRIECKHELYVFFLFCSIGLFANNVVGLAITLCVIGVSLRKNSVHQLKKIYEMGQGRLLI